MTTHEEYVTYAQAKVLKELGFDWPCRVNYHCVMEQYRLSFGSAEYSNSEIPEWACVAPTQAVACRWLREEKGIALNVETKDGGKYHCSTIYLPNFNEEGYKWYRYHPCPLMDTYESALSAGIDRELELLTSNNNQQ